MKRIAVVLGVVVLAAVAAACGEGGIFGPGGFGAARTGWVCIQKNLTGDPWFGTEWHCTDSLYLKPR